MEEVKELNSKKNNKLLIRIIAIILIIAIFVCSWFLFGRDTKEEKKNKEENQKFEIKKENITPLMYKITKDGSNNIIYLFGSMHLVNLNEFDFPEYVMNAYNDSHYLACEFDLIEYERNLDTSKYIEDLMYKDGTTIKDHISEETYNKMVKFLQEHYTYNERLDSFTVYYFESLISNMIYKDSGIKSSGVDTYFLKKAKEDNKTILEVETPEFQQSILTGFPDRLYEMSILDMIDNYEESIADAKTLYKAWKDGDVDKLIELEKDIDDDREYTEEDLKLIDEYNKKLLTDRNILMTDKLVEYFTKDEDVFYMVGAAHLVGDDGIAKLLEQRGFTVTRIN